MDLKLAASFTRVLPGLGQFPGRKEAFGHFGAFEPCRFHDTRARRPDSALYDSPLAACPNPKKNARMNVVEV